MKALVENDFWAELSWCEAEIGEIWQIAGEQRAEAGMSAHHQGGDAYEAMFEAQEKAYAFPRRVDAFIERSRAQLAAEAA